MAILLLYVNRKRSPNVTDFSFLEIKKKVCQVQPDNYRKIDEIVKGTNGGTLEVVTVAVQAEGEGKIE